MGWGVARKSRTSVSDERAKGNWMGRGAVTDNKTFCLLPSLAYGKSHYRQIFRFFSKAFSFSEARLSEIWFGILVLVPFTTDIQILSVLAVDDEARLVSSGNSYSEFSYVWRAGYQQSPEWKNECVHTLVNFWTNDKDNSPNILKHSL